MFVFQTLFLEKLSLFLNTKNRFWKMYKNKKKCKK